MTLAAGLTFFLARTVPFIFGAEQNRGMAINVVRFRVPYSYITSFILFKF
jgi:hypothetical protein